MHLEPKRPPGRIDRKAADYAAEIVRLRAAGYTYEAIREALVDVGIELSQSALRREVRRWQRDRTAAPGARAVSAVPQPQPWSAATAQATGPPRLPSGSGHDIAAAFFEANLSNPLFRSQETS